MENRSGVIISSSLFHFQDSTRSVYTLCYLSCNVVLYRNRVKLYSAAISVCLLRCINAAAAVARNDSAVTSINHRTANNADYEPKVINAKLINSGLSV